MARIPPWKSMLELILAMVNVFIAMINAFVLQTGQLFYCLIMLAMMAGMTRSHDAGRPSKQDRTPHVMSNNKIIAVLLAILAIQAAVTSTAL